MFLETSTVTAHRPPCTLGQVCRLLRQQQSLRLSRGCARGLPGVTLALAMSSGSALAAPSSEVAGTMASADSLSGCALGEFATHLLAWVKEALDKCGGPVQYLLARYSTNEAKASFGEALSTSFTPDDSEHYEWKGPLPNSQATTSGPLKALCLHPMLFAWGQDAAVKSFPELHTSVRLAEEILLDGFFD